MSYHYCDRCHREIFLGRGYLHDFSEEAVHGVQLPNKVELCESCKEEVEEEAREIVRKAFHAATFVMDTFHVAVLQADDLILGDMLDELNEEVRKQ